MKKMTLLVVIVCCSMGLFAQGIGINTDGSQPHTSSALDIKSSSKGLLVPRMTTAQKNLIASPANGLMVFDTDLNTFCFYNGTAWSTISGGGFSLPYQAIVNYAGAAFTIINTPDIGILGEGANIGVLGKSSSVWGVYGESTTGTGIYGKSNAGVGAFGESVTGTGVYAISNTGTGLRAFSTSDFAIEAMSTNKTAIKVTTNNGNPSIHAINSNGLGEAIRGESTLHNAIVGISTGSSKSGIRGEGSSNAHGVVGIANNAATYAVYGNNAIGIGVYGFSTSGTGVKAFSGSGNALEVDGNLKIAGGTVAPTQGAVLTSDASGNAVWKNNRIAFSVKDVNTSEIGIAHNTVTKVHFETEEYDYGNNYNLLIGSNPVSLSSVFTVPVTGVYHFDAISTIINHEDDLISGFIRLTMNRNGVISALAVGTTRVDNYYSFAREVEVSISVDLKLQANDKIWLEVFQFNEGESGGTISGGVTRWNGHLVFAD